MTVLSPLTSLAERFSGKDHPSVDTTVMTLFREQAKDVFLLMYTNNCAGSSEKDYSSACDTLVSNFDTAQEQQRNLINYLRTCDDEEATEVPSVSSDSSTQRLNLITEAMETILNNKDCYKTKKIIADFEKRLTPSN